jgi:protein-S-isoprenylcysteine O-methyltransferase Ste14
LAKSRSWIGIALLTPIGVLVAVSRPHYRMESWGHFFFEAMGWLLFLAGASMRWWATLYIGARKTIELIVDGPYSVTRNPIYFGTFLLTLSVGVLSQSAVFLVAVMLVATAYLLVTVRTEEVLLGQCHGDAFADYCKKVPRFFPRPGRFHSRETIEVRIGGLYSEFVRMGRWVWIPILCDLVTHLRFQEYWPDWFSLP